MTEEKNKIKLLAILTQDPLATPGEQVTEGCVNNRVAQILTLVQLVKCS